MKIFSHYNPPPKIDLSVQTESMTQQSFYEDTKIDNILKKFANVGINPADTLPPLNYADVSGLPSYQEHMDKLIEIQDYFEQLPSKTRLMFENDPAKFASFVADPANEDKAVELGLLERIKSPDSELSNSVPSTPITPEIKPAVEPLKPSTNDAQISE